MRVIYKRTDGIATDIQRWRPDFGVPPGFLVTDDTSDISQEALSDPVAWAAKVAAEQDKETRRQAVKTEAEADNFIDRLRGATPNQITAFVQAQVTDLASAKQFLAKLGIAVAYALQGGRDK